MKFNEVVLEARYRLHDIRTAESVLITEATQDGIRWTSLLMASICRSALIEMSRTFISLKLENVIGNDVQTRLISTKLATGSQWGEATGLENPKFYKLLNIVEPDSSKVYHYVGSEEFLDMAWRNTKDSDGDSVVRRVFTTMYDETSKAIKVLVLPTPTADIENCKAIAKYPLEELFVIGSEVDIPFYNLSDLMMDYIEKQARQREHSPAQVQLLDGVIKQKLGELTVESKV